LFAKLNWKKFKDGQLALQWQTKGEGRGARAEE